MKFLKKCLYWLSLVAPVVDATKVVINAINNGIIQGKEDVRREKERANCEYFNRCMSNTNDGVDAKFGGFYKGDDQ